MPEKTVDYEIVKNIDFDQKYRYCLIYIADGAEGCSYLVKVSREATEKEIIDCIKHDYISSAIKDGWDDDLYIEDIGVQEIPYLVNFMEIGGDN